MWKGIVGILLLTGIALFGALALAGMFDKPEVMEREMGPFTLVYKKVEGEYQQAGIFIETMKTWLSEHGVKSKTSFALYFDNPQNVDYSNLRFITGHFLEKEDMDKQAVIGERYIIKEFPRVRCIVGAFPYRSRMSNFFGLMKVYPELGTWRESKGYKEQPIMELYDKEAKQILYLEPIDPGCDMLQEYFMAKDKAELEKEAEAAAAAAVATATATAAKSSLQGNTLTPRAAPAVTK